MHKFRVLLFHSVEIARIAFERIFSAKGQIETVSVYGRIKPFIKCLESDPLDIVLFEIAYPFIQFENIHNKMKRLSMNAPRIGIVASKQMKAFAKFLDLEAVISLEDSSASILRITEALISRKKAESKSRSNTDFYDTATIPIRLEALTKTEQNFFEHLTKGRSIKEISYKMGISQKTANNHRDAIKRKMGIATSRELELLAFTFGFQIREHHS